jgi:hypothetical protein
MSFKNHKEAVARGHSVALAVAIRRFRDEYKWNEESVRAIGWRLVGAIRDRIDREVESLSRDIVRMDELGRSEDDMADCVIATFALVGAQVSESFEMSRRAERN